MQTNHTFEIKQELVGLRFKDNDTIDIFTNNGNKETKLFTINPSALIIPNDEQISDSNLQKTIKFLEFRDFASGLIKAFFFGTTVVILGCYKGYTATKGAAGVGFAATSSVVTSSVMILLMNYLITGFMFDK